MIYSIGAKVRINSIDWFNERGGEKVYLNHGVFDREKARHCGKIVTIKRNIFNTYFEFEEIGGEYTDEMFECLIKPTYNIGDYVGIYGYETDVKIADLRYDGPNYAYKVYLADGEEWLYDDDIAYVANADEEIEYTTTKPDEDSAKNNIVAKTIICGDQYEFIDDNNNVINTTKIIIKKKPLDVQTKTIINKYDYNIRRITNSLYNSILTKEQQVN